MSKITKENAKEYQARGVESRHQHKTVREAFKAKLSMPVTDKKQLSTIEKSGLPVGKNPTYLDFICASAVVNSAMSGKVDDVLKIMSIIGESLDDTNIQSLNKAEELLGGVDSAID